MDNNFKFRCGSFLLDLTKKTHIMGILNITPDSFSDGGLFFDANRAIEQGLALAKEGADIIDIGAESTRPGAKEVPAKIQINRITPALKVLAKELKIPISVDTCSFQVAKVCIEEGASIINDVTGLKKDVNVAKLVARHRLGIVLMHAKGMPRTMQRHPQYKDLIGEIVSSLKRSIKIAKDYGINDEGILVDPGIGFGKTLEHNLIILKRLREFKILKKPILIGASRKSFIGKILNKDVGDRLFGTIASIVTAVNNGASIVRVHDVAEVRDAVRITNAILGVKG